MLPALRVPGSYGTAVSQLRVCVCVCIHTAKVSAAVLLLTALSLFIEFALDNGRQYTVSLVSSIVMCSPKSEDQKVDQF